MNSHPFNYLAELNSRMLYNFNEGYFVVLSVYSRRINGTCYSNEPQLAKSTEVPIVLPKLIVVLSIRRRLSAGICSRPLSRAWATMGY